MGDMPEGVEMETKWLSIACAIVASVYMMTNTVEKFAPHECTKTNTQAK